MTAREAGSADCEPDGMRKGFKYLGSTHRGDDNPAYYILYAYFMYKQSKARKYGESRTRYTKQLEMCSAGGASSKGGNRLDNAITIMSLRTQKPRLIDRTWDTGTDQSHADASMTFEVGKAPVTVSATLTGLNPQDRLAGRQGHHKAATADTFGRFKFNQVNAEWDGRSGPSVYAGSTGYQGNVGHALWELPERARTPTFAVEAVVYYHCGRVFGGCEDAS
ncbi:MAG: hypothetical protein ACRDKY_05790 [Solirubrobacteraceae bacterium]